MLRFWQLVSRRRGRPVAFPLAEEGLVGKNLYLVFMMHVPQGVNVDAKRKMAKKINDAVAEAYHLPKFMVFMHEYPLDLVALEGGFHSDNKARVEAQGKVYAGLQGDQR